VSLRKDFTGATAIIHDESNVLMANVRIIEYDSSENSIEVPDLPVLTEGAKCSVLIMSTPVPYSYQGRIHKRLKKRVITLFKGETVEARKFEQRFKTDMPARIVALYNDGKLHSLHTPAIGRILNISKGGLRLRAVYNALNIGDKFQAHIENGEFNTKIMAEVVGRSDTEGGLFSEFSCRFFGDSAVPDDYAD